MSDTIREPQQQRAIEKKNKIIKAGYKLFAEKGYFNTNTVEIAKEAGVSTGIIYGYFRDKRDIILEVLDLYIDTVFKPVFELFDKLTAPLDFKKIIDKILQVAIDAHRDNAQIHEALHSLTNSDKEISNRFMDLERQMTDKIVIQLRKAGYESENAYEKVHLAIETVQSFCHEYIYDHHSFIDYDKMQQFVKDMLLTLFK